MIMEEKIFFAPGDVVQMKQDIPNKPKMVVIRIERSIIKNTDGNTPPYGRFKETFRKIL